MTHKEYFHTNIVDNYLPQEWKDNIHKMYDINFEKNLNGGSTLETNPEYFDFTIPIRGFVSVVYPCYFVTSKKMYTSIEIDYFTPRNICDAIYYWEFSGYPFTDSQYVHITKFIENLVSTYELTETKILKKTIPKDIKKKKRKNIKSKKVEIKVLDTIENSSGFKTYLMKDNNNNLYKIGKSKNPKFRERTLQSEKPSIDVVKVWNKDIETILHENYKEQRIRGEWFKLTHIQVRYICTHY